MVLQLVAMRDHQTLERGRNGAKGLVMIDENTQEWPAEEWSEELSSCFAQYPGGGHLPWRLGLGQHWGPPDNHDEEMSSDATLGAGRGDSPGGMQRTGSTPRRGDSANVVVAKAWLEHVMSSWRSQEVGSPGPSTYSAQGSPAYWETLHARPMIQKHLEAHRVGVCRPCVFAPKGKCMFSEGDCAFCHYPGHLKNKRTSKYKAYYNQERNSAFGRDRPYVS